MRRNSEQYAESTMSEGGLMPKPYPLSPSLCYNRRAAVNFTANPEFAGDSAQPAMACDSLKVHSQAGQVPALRNEDPSRYCPVCSQRLESRRCKLICSVCGYYMSCADYY
jgi:hypothetical protein